MLGVDFTHYSRSIIMEVLRGMGCVNQNMHFTDSEAVLEFGTDIMTSDVMLLSHEADAPVDFDTVSEMRRHEIIERAQIPMVLLSSITTRSLIEYARDHGVDEIVSRPVSPVQLYRKLRQLVESPRPFVTAANYVGPCRRRKEDDQYSGPRRRIDDYSEDLSREIPEETGANELAIAVSELREACGRLSDDRLGLIARVRQTAERTARLAKETGDIPLERTAAAVKLYLEGVGSQNLMETHVLETGINALTQLAILPQSYHGARQSVASLMTVAVRKKLMVYEHRRKNADKETERILDKINSGDNIPETENVDLDEAVPPQRSTA